MTHAKFPSRFGKYILLDRISTGGMAEVFCAKVTGPEDFQRLVAMKSMLPALARDEQFISMFVDEAKLAAQLHHPNVVQIYELGRLRGHLYIAMELVHGRDLRHILKTSQATGIQVPPAFAAYVLSKAAEGLDYAHRLRGPDGRELQLVHRDVSPQNILVSYDGDVKMVDFGIAKAEMRATQTQAGVLKGKFAYMAPELVAGLPTDRRADIFALGIVLFETLTSRRLFVGDSDMQVLEKVRKAEITDIRTLLPACPSEALRALSRTLTREPDARYDHASQLAEQLEPLLIDERSIFGPKRAAQFMRELFGTEIDAQRERIRHFARVTALQCHDWPWREEVIETAGFERPPRASVDDLNGNRYADTVRLEPQALLLPTREPQPEAQQQQQQQASPMASVGPPVSLPYDESVADAHSDWSISTSNVFAQEALEGLRAAARKSLAAESPSSQTSDVTPAPGSLESVGGDGVGAGAGATVQTRSVGSERRAPFMLFLGALAVAAIILVLAVGMVLYEAHRRRNTSVVTEVPAAASPPDHAPAPPPAATPSLPDTEGEGEGEPQPGEQARGRGASRSPLDGRGARKRARPTGSARGVDRSQSIDAGQAAAVSGILSVQVKGVRMAKVYVDKQDAGYAPVVGRRVPVGTHVVRVVEFGEATPGRQIVRDVVVTAKHDAGSPAVVVVEFVP